VIGLPVTQLEIATIAFSIFLIATYFVNWWKPKDVIKPTLLKAPIFGVSTTLDKVVPIQQFTIYLINSSESGS
jgi:hypothetical protein